MGVLSIFGPTASGKSELALILSQILDGEIISCDSMQVYKNMDIGTAKPSQEEQELVPHHLVDIYDIHQRYSASRFVELATEIIKDIQKRGKTPILAGGTGMYARLLLYGGDMLPADRTLHAQLRERLTSEGQESLLKDLLQLDPRTAEAVQGNERRTLRALEAVMLSGSPLPGKTSWGDEAIIPGLQVINMCEAKLNRERIAKRCIKMLNSGWIEETEALTQQGLFDTPTAFQSLGYKQIADYTAGTFGTFEELQQKIITLTSRYAKRQRTWFRNQHKGALMIDRQVGDSAKEIAQHVAQLWSERKERDGTL